MNGEAEDDQSRQPAGAPPHESKNPALPVPPGLEGEGDLDPRGSTMRSLAPVGGMEGNVIGLHND